MVEGQRVAHRAGSLDPEGLAGTAVPATKEVVDALLLKVIRGAVRRSPGVSLLEVRDGRGRARREASAGQCDSEKRLEHRVRGTTTTRVHNRYSQ